MGQNNDLEDFIIKLSEDVDDIGKLRDRAMYEDGILNSRTNIVLVFNAILAAAVNIASSGNVYDADGVTH